MKNARTVLKTAASKQIRKHRTPAMLKPIVGALLASGLASSAHAIDTVWFGGSGDWGVGPNWSQGIPGAGDVAVISAGTATLGFNTSIQGLTQGGGSVSGTGDLTLTGAYLDWRRHQWRGHHDF